MVRCIAALLIILLTAPSSFGQNDDAKDKAYKKALEEREKEREIYNNIEEKYGKDSLLLYFQKEHQA